MKPSHERRLLLKAIGAAPAASAFLQWLAPPAHAAGSPPPRLVILWTPHGPPWEFLRPKTTGPGGQLTPDSLVYNQSILEPCKAFADQTLILEGLSYKCRMDQNAGGEDYVGHEDSATTFLSGQRVPNLGQGGVAVSGPTLDQFLGSKLQGQTAIASAVVAMLDAGPNAQSGNNTFSYDANRKPTAGLMRPDDVPSGLYRRLFGGFTAPAGGGSDPTAANRELARRRSVVQTLARQAKTFQGRLANQERQKLEMHLQGLADIERKLGAPAPTIVGCTAPRAPVRPTSVSDYQEKWTMTHGAAEFGALADVIAHGFACDRTRVVLGYGGMSGTVPWEPSLSFIKDMHHEVAHYLSTNDANAMKIARDRMAIYMRSIARLFSGLLERLQSIAEGNGTLLDNTIVLWGTEFGDPSGHAGRNVGFVVFGGRNYLQTGFHRKYPSTKVATTPHNHLLAALCHPFGLKVNGFGDARYQGVLTDILKT
ncbi:MAG: DUF1552 domain-containing protein [Deltaproteobacteria bacterium]|nr:DUF1552 domain-containing protein [Deltaproteobacteria bacterium]